MLDSDMKLLAFEFTYFGPLEKRNLFASLNRFAFPVPMWICEVSGDSIFCCCPFSSDRRTNQGEWFVLNSTQTDIVFNVPLVNRGGKCFLLMVSYQHYLIWTWTASVLDTYLCKINSCNCNSSLRSSWKSENSRLAFGRRAVRFPCFLLQSG